MMNRTITTATAVSLCLFASIALGAGGMESESVGFLKGIYDLIYAVFPYAAVIALFFSLFPIARGNWTPLLLTGVMVFIGSVIPLIVEYVADRTI